MLLSSRLQCHTSKSLRWNTNRKYLDHITPTELQRNIDPEEDKLNNLKEINPVT